MYVSKKHTLCVNIGYSRNYHNFHAHEFVKVLHNFQKILEKSKTNFHLIVSQVVFLFFSTWIAQIFKILHSTSWCSPISNVKQLRQDPA